MVVVGIVAVDIKVVQLGGGGRAVREGWNGDEERELPVTYDWRRIEETARGR